MNYAIIYVIIYNIIIIIAFISTFFSFIIYIMKKISFHIINFNVIKKILSSRSNIKLRNFQIIKKRHFLINEIINEIIILKNRFNYHIFIIVKTLTFIYNRRYRKR